MIAAVGVCVHPRGKKPSKGGGGLLTNLQGFKSLNFPQYLAESPAHGSVLTAKYKVLVGQQAKVQAMGRIVPPLAPLWNPQFPKKHGGLHASSTWGLEMMIGKNIVSVD